MQIAIKLDAGNDRNGNPRRGWLVYDASKATVYKPSTPVYPGSIGRLIGWCEEGYAGMAALKDAYPKALELCQLSVPYSEIRAARKNAPETKGNG